MRYHFYVQLSKITTNLGSMMLSGGILGMLFPSMMLLYIITSVMFYIMMFFLVLVSCDMFGMSSRRVVMLLMV